MMTHKKSRPIELMPNLLSFAFCGVMKYFFSIPQIMELRIVVCLFVLFGMSLDGVSCEIKNCTSSPCDLKTCQNTAAKCKQFCSASPCKTSCQSTAGCEANCLSGNCTKMACDVPIKDKNTPWTSICHLTCKKDCPDMSCTAHLCYPDCQEDNCKLSCTGRGGDSQNPAECYPRCLGKKCTIHCKSLYCEAACEQGGCDIKFSKVTFGTVSCKENCTLTCAKGKNCRFIRACPNCKTFVVDDPFPPTNNTLPPTNNTLPVRPNNAGKMHFLLTTHVLFSSSFISAFIFLLL